MSAWEVYVEELELPPMAHGTQWPRDVPGGGRAWEIMGQVRCSD